MQHLRMCVGRSRFALRSAVVLIVAGGAFGGAAIAPAVDAMGVSPTALAKPCSSRYVHATLSWGHKCLATGQFCKVGNREYRRYGFYRPATGHLRRR
jgi:hypothetical protein